MLLLAIVTLLAAGCGFHLRGTQPVDETLRTVAVRDLANTLSAWYGGERDALQHVVVRALEEDGLRVADEATRVIELLGEDVTRRTAAVGANASAAEYRIDYRLRYRVRSADGTELLAETTIRRDHVYRYDVTAPLGSAEEESLLRRELRRSAARQLASRYRRLAPAPGTSPAESPAEGAGHESTAP